MLLDVSKFKMLYYLSQKLLEWTKGTPWADHLSALRLFRYITVRSAGAAVTALVSLAAGIWCTGLLAFAAAAVLWYWIPRTARHPAR